MNKKKFTFASLKPGQTIIVLDHLHTFVVGDVVSAGPEKRRGVIVETPGPPRFGPHTAAPIGVRLADDSSDEKLHWFWPVDLKKLDPVTAIGQLA